MTTTQGRWTILFSSLAVLAAQRASGVSDYVSLVPNGSVNSCTTCHASVPTRNAFGNAFASASHTWSSALAGLDSDGDGFSNGKELGDPTGVWRPGAALPIPGAQVTQPGSASSMPTLVPPEVSITSPTSGGVFPANFTGPITVSSTTPAAGISKVDFYSGTTLLGTDTTSPFSLPVNLGAGSYTLSAKLTDYLGAVGTSASVSITVNSSTPLTVQLTSPPNGATYTAPANVSLVATASSGNAITQVAFYQGALQLGSVSAAPYAFTLVNLAAGSYTFTARATDSSGATATSSAVNITVNPVTPPPPPPPTSPVVTVTATQPNASEIGPINGVFQVARTGATTSALIVSYTLSGTAVNGADYVTLPGTVTIPAGSATANVVVTPLVDNDSPPEISDTVILQISAATGRSAYAVGTPANAVVTILESTTPPPPPTGNEAPEVELVRPSDGSRYRAGTTIMLIADAHDSDGTVAKVEFFAGTRSLGTGVLITRGEREDDDEEDGGTTASAGRYALIWPRVPAGTYVVTAVVTDDQGATATSNRARITVTNRVRRGDD
jgi:hypothetical protein